MRYSIEELEEVILSVFEKGEVLSTNKIQTRLKIKVNWKTVNRYLNILKEAKKLKQIPSAKHEINLWHI